MVPRRVRLRLSNYPTLDAASSSDLARLGAFLRQFPWYELIPDEPHSIVTAGYGKDTSTALTAYTPDGKLSITYLPSTGIDPREFAINTAPFHGSVMGRWFNPAGPGSPELNGFLLTSDGQQRVSTPGDNGTKANDWLLVLQAQ